MSNDPPLIEYVSAIMDCDMALKAARSPKERVAVVEALQKLNETYRRAAAYYIEHDGACPDHFEQAHSKRVNAAEARLLDLPAFVN